MTVVPPDGEDPWHPEKVGDVFILDMPNGSHMLMRVTEITDDTHWKSTQANIDDAMSAPNFPHFQFKQ